jgi:O-antigen biosynthesis protein
MISIITPSHNTRFLKELETTILAQTYQEWEWVLLLNNGAKYVATDPRIKIIECPFTSDSVGFMKRLACMQATGEVIAEVDHDDLLTPDCLAKVTEAFKDEEVGFVFSQNAKLSKDFRPYMEEYGWKHKKFRWNKQSLYAMENQPVYPGRLGHIWFAPDHIRCWRRDVYEKIGGHDDSLKVCDDLDLMHRLYLVTKFKEIPEVLYVYRITGDNTYLTKNALIKETNNKLYDNNIHKLAARFAQVNDLLSIDLNNYVPDLENGLPLSDNIVGVIRATDVLQHVKNTQKVMSEIHRVLAPGGMLLSATPSTDGRGAFQDPTHVSFWNENSFWYYTQPSFARRIKNTKLFRECKLKTGYLDEFSKEHDIKYVIAHLEKI